jgi:hypothetical protein
MTALKTAETEDEVISVVMTPVYWAAFAVRAAHVALIDIPGPSSPLRGGSEVEKTPTRLLYVTIWSGAQTGLETKTTRVGRGARRSES